MRSNRPFHTTLSTKTLNSLTALSQAEGLPKNAIIDKAVELYKTKKDYEEYVKAADLVLSNIVQREVKKIITQDPHASRKRYREACG